MNTKKLSPVLTILFAGAALLGLTAYETASGQASAHAEEVVAKRSASIYASPGEQAMVRTRIEAGDTMSVLSKKGRWYKVRVNGFTGWVPRSKVSSRAARSTVRKSRRSPFVEGRSRRSARSAPRDRVGGDATEDGFLDEEEAPRKRSARRQSRDDFDDDFDDEDADDDFADEEEEEEDAEESVVVTANKATVYSKPQKRARKVDSARQGSRFFVVRRKGRWIQVEDDDGQGGWIRASDVGSRLYKYEKLTKRGGASLGYAAVSQDFTSSSAPEQLGKYKISSGSAQIALGGELIYDYSEEYLIGGDLSYRYSKASPGIRYEDAMGNAVDIGFQSHQADVGAKVGYKISRESGMAAYGRVGYHFGKFAIDDVEDFTKNTAKLPSEILKGITIGAHLDIPMLSEKYAVRAGIDALYPQGSRQQTAGLEDGQLSDVFALWATARVDYQWKKNLKLIGSYQFFRAKTTWTGRAVDSERDHMAADAERTDTTHALTVGVGRAF